MKNIDYKCEYAYKKEMVDSLCEYMLSEKDLRVPKSHMSDIVDAFSAVIYQMLSEGKGVRLGSALKLTLKYVPEKEYRSPLTGGTVTKPERLVPCVKLNAAWRKEIEQNLLDGGLVPAGGKVEVDD